MKLKLWQIDAFANHVLEGNPAAVVPLESWIEPRLMQKIANENNLAETAFFVKTATGRYDLRWFTPEAEVDLCGHATLASAWTVFEFLDPELKAVSFQTRSGELIVTRGRDGRHTMSLPSDMATPFDAQEEIARAVGDVLGVAPPKEIYRARYLLAVWDDAKIVRNMKGPGDVASLLRKIGMWGLIATAKGDEGYDFVSRFFAPDKGVPEDPVTGSAHCALTPFWAKRLSKKTMKARQVSPRGGDLVCTDEGARTVISGPCALYMTGEISV
ncbi:MAG: PhzF family phenazine biosynthesis protein [Alphaproteobacteria bacterium]|nr:PhzF family phenazine biosynthesis protein [Alphaproteobacteria bacterium]MDE2111410.1 PhzF family phenazine biosynthesis protein [Alphaproteobacteria bacterium]MDE2495537.1 PhzF family phenazine biosynthesis protein [Alphaproteobacteria bacterium]